MMNIEILFFDGCPTHKEAQSLTEAVLQEKGLEATFKITNVTNDDEAKKYGFIGSPTIRIEGRDVEKDAREVKDFGRKCRIYLVDGKTGGLPSKEMVRDTLREVLDENSHACCR